MRRRSFLSALVTFSSFQKATIFTARSRSRSGKERGADLRSLYDLLVRNTGELSEHDGTPRFHDHHSTAFLLPLRDLGGDQPRSIAATATSIASPCALWACS